ncbi:helix-turn-helix transcriptional regulator [Bacillus sp. FJAT-45350]|uniref:helix-turn-helix transcriptional regulator n=1 Tax=Bacillus sp. FJAT-45350 TaxID=2011014 RepID=UPI000BB7E862|nr:helix-turn-helix domain-containing protein [Bacillus sp. FJAT-45350]
MEQQTLKITNVLSDPTRFSIYQFVSKRHGDVTVQEIADNFKIHANVARLHLTKLEDVKMLISETKKTGKGGRPSRFYRLSEEVISLQFPYRDYQMLSNLALETLATFGEEGKKAIKNIGYKYGIEAAKSFLSRVGKDVETLSVEEKMTLVEQMSNNQGLNPEFHYNDEDKTINFKIYNCTFKELINDHSATLCIMHHSFLVGIFTHFFGQIKLEENELMTEPDCSACSYTTVVIPN